MAWIPRGLNNLVDQTPLAEKSAGNSKTSSDAASPDKTVTNGIMGLTASASSSKPKGNICPRCNKPVYFAEEVKAVGQSFHKLCYRCTHCKKSINGANFSEHDGNLYDNNCYQRLFGPKGVGFGIGAGALSTGN
ncbi:unnamed protein product [Adineta ricciae]|uniref:LIM zinc-binding domain-containing protein n=1 Tax=Adineta ricciae TaxID=249248 RepID=A0A813XHZ9_ADIRI|nr:unnamed protein product [Adineta ricciae]CAF1317288.1 unnamed protein product [Adineta ricciae]